MKLRNKKTGETIDVVVNPTDFNTVRLCRVNTVKSLQAVNTWEYNSLAELNEDWEDYEEPKEHWFVDSGGEVEETTYLTENDKANLTNFGNYFNTKEEAEKAVEKLKAWKRLKDKGFRFNGWCDRGAEPVGDMGFGLPKSGEEWSEDEIADLDLLFGGEE